MEAIEPSRAVLLVVHMQYDIADARGAFGGFFSEEAERNRTVAKVDDLLGTVREAGMHVVYPVIAFENDYSDLVPNVPLLAMVGQFGAAVKGTRQTEVLEELKPQEGELVLLHTRTSPFQDTPLDRLLRARGIDTVIVCGIATNASVEDAARYAGNLGYRTIIASDACSASSLAAHEASLQSLALFGEVADTAQIAAALADGAE